MKWILKLLGHREPENIVVAESKQLAEWAESMSTVDRDARRILDEEKRERECELDTYVRPDGVPRFEFGGVLYVTPDEFVKMRQVCDRLSRIRYEFGAEFGAEFKMVEQISAIINVPTEKLLDKEWVIIVPEWVN